MHDPVASLKHAETQLRLMTKVFMDGADPLIIRDMDGRVLDINHEVERVFGWPRAELVGQRTRHLLPPELREAADLHLEHLQRGEAIRNVEAAVRTKAGQMIPVLVTSFLLTDEDGAAVGIANIIKDISTLKRIGDDSFSEIARHWDARRSGGDPLAQLIAVQMIYLDYALAHPHLFDHAFLAPREDARRFPDDFRARRSPTFNVVHDAVVEAQQAKMLRAGDAWDIAMTLWAHSHGLIALYRAGRFSYDDRRFPAFYRESLERLLDGLKQPA